ncbi:hypothetical protein DENSPDRAFT_148019 [Dentipellis sp. KUC8613]|nr:hypothetical protein DENSPDRAFT_148019 [Dentipellis sp. KUC8613]
MSESESTPNPRRSQRDRKQAKQFISGPRKRKHTDSDTDDEELSDIEENESVHDADEEEDFSAPKPKPKAGSGTGKRGRPKGSASAAKRPRTTKTAQKRPTGTNSRKGKKTQAGDDAFDTSKISQEAKITADNSLFNAIMNPSSALQSTVEDYLESLTETPEAAQAQLVNCILRACGCNETVDGDGAVNYDGVVDALDYYTEALKKDDSPIYPLTSKLPMFKKFRKSLSEFLERLITSAAELGSLYSTDIMATLQTWVVAMSSSQLRSFRHTATVVALEVETALCDVAAAVEKEAEVIARQKEGERKRKAGKKDKGSNAREKELEGKAAEVRERRTQLAELLKEFVDGVFVHRYRDLDPAIRAECVHAIGQWFKKYPSHFLDGTYLRYVGWVLSDGHTHVRLEAVKALSGVYQQADYIGSLQHFTDRFKPRLVEMATGDTELTIRVTVIAVLGAIDGHGLLEDEQRERLCLLVFDEEAKVRRAVSGFVRGVWNDMVEERLAGRKVSDQDQERAGVKALGMLLVKLGKALDKLIGQSDEDDTDNDGLAGGGEGSSGPKRVKEVAALVGAEQKGRTALAVEALWDEVDPVQDWEALLDVLLLDHSATGDDEVSVPRNRRGKGKQTNGDAGVDEAWRLEEVEEAVLLEVLVAAIRKVQVDATAAHSKKAEDDTVSSDVTRALIKGLPRLFAKHQTDEKRIAEVLLIPQLMNLDLYLEMRMMAAYASLWDDVIKQFTTHSSLIVLSRAVATIRHFMEATSLSNTNSTKILELEDDLASSLRDAVAGRDELEIASFTEDEVILLGAICTRLHKLAGERDMTSWMEEDEGGKQSSAWDIISALVDRGKLGYKEEEKMIDQGIQLLTLHVIWKARRLPPDPHPSPEEAKFRESFREQREALLEKLVEYAVGSQSNTADGVRRSAFENLMQLHILFCPPQSAETATENPPTSFFSLTLDDEVQYRCVGFVQAEIERYAEELEEDDSESQESEDEEEQSNSEGGQERAKAKAGKRKKTARSNGHSRRTTTRSRLEREYMFLSVITTFLRAIRAGAINARHSAVLLSYYGRLGPAVDLCSKAIVEVLRDEGMYKDNGDVVVAVVTQALRDAFTSFLEGVVSSEAPSVALAKVFVSCLMIRGAQLAVVRRLDAQYVVEIHTSLLTWIGKRIASYEANKNRKSRNASILFFKVLQPLLAPIDNRDALRIKAHLDQILAQTKVEMSATSAIWEPQRAYEKRLATAMAKTKAPGGRARKSAAKSKEMVTTDDEQGATTGEETEAPAPPPRSRPRARPANRSRRTEPEEDVGSDQEQDQAGVASEPEDDGPKSPSEPAQSPPRTPEAPRSPSRLSSLPDEEPAEQEDEDAMATPKASSSRKRGRSDQEEGSDLENGDQGEGSPAASSPARAPASRANTPGEIQVRRKRARH